MPVSAKARASAQQAVIVHVHTAAPPKRARRRVKKRQQGARATGASAFNMPIPSQHPGQFYMHAPVPRLVAENIQVGRLGQGQVPQVGHVPAAQAAQAANIPQGNQVAQVANIPVVQEFRPTQIKTEVPVVRASPSRGELIPKMEFADSRKFKLDTPPKSFIHIPDEIPYQHLASGPTRVGASEIPYQHLASGPATQSAPQSDSDSSESGSRLAPEVLTHDLPTIDENATPPIGVLRAHHTRAKGPTGLVSPLGSVPEFRNKGAREKLEHFLATAPQPEIAKWFGTPNGGGYLQRARGGAGKGNRPLTQDFVDVILQAHRANVGGPAGAA